ncbi:MAG: hypothetical protein Q7S52_05980 [bacterium]|nr:hypothetical protein [bacterium]
MSKTRKPKLQLKYVKLVGNVIPVDDSKHISIGDEEGSLVVINDSRKRAREMLKAIDSCLDNIATLDTTMVAEFSHGGITYKFEVSWSELNGQRFVDINGRGYLPDGTESGDEYENDVMANAINIEDWKTLVAFV